ncbi:MAG: recombinase family protein [Rickettsiales bacterium]|jgi:DNA invertase Pin-like site-specific DNA recombinase|nr:recombinase family protein [Rickettsiales bacterium]
MIFNYRRVSTADQSFERQLYCVGCDFSYDDIYSGRNAEDRTQLKAMLLNLKPRDMINVQSIDRLARNTIDLIKIVNYITGKGCKIKFFSENLVFSGIEGEASANPLQECIMTMLAALAQMENVWIAERRTAGIKIAKEKCVYKGRRRKLNESDLKEVKDLYNVRKSIPKIARHFSCCAATIRNYLKKIGEYRPNIDEIRDERLNRDRINYQRKKLEEKTRKKQKVGSDRDLLSIFSDSK